MHKKVIFIGRNKEINSIIEASLDKDTRSIICIGSKNSSGGIGKTRLLQKTREILLSKQIESCNILISNIIDFDNHFFHIPRNIAHKVADRLGGEYFQDYKEREADVEKTKKIDLSADRRAEDLNALNQSFADCFNQCSEKQRIVLFFDTSDALKADTKIWKTLLNLLPLLKNYAIIIAGRNAQEVRSFLQTSLENTNSDSSVKFSEITLNPFSESESRAYLSVKQEQLYTPLDSDVMEKLLILANGRPILIDLAIEWHSRNPVPDWMLDITLSELQTLPNKEKNIVHEKFEKQLILHIADVRHDIDRLTLALAHVYPMNVSMISKLLQLDKQVAETLFNTAKQCVFIKILPDDDNESKNDELLSLHDEMRRMVNQYLWEEVDLDGHRQRYYSHVALEYFTEEQKRLREEIIDKTNHESKDLFTQANLIAKYHLVVQKRVKHALIADMNTGFKIYKLALVEAKREEDYNFAFQLIQLTKEYKKSFNDDQLFDFEDIHAGLLCATGQSLKAKKLYQTMLKSCESDVKLNHSTRLKRIAELNNGLGVSEVNLGNFVDSLKPQLKSFDLYVKNNELNNIALTANYIGYTYRLMGQWTRAIYYYQIALKAANDLGSNVNTIASISNNLGYVYALDGKFDEAINYCGNAYDMWLEMGKAIMIANTEVTLAQIYNFQDNTSQAIRYAQQALYRFQENDAEQQLFRSYHCLAWAHWIRGNPDNERLLRKSQKYFNKSIESANDNNQIKELSGILINNSYVHWALGNKDKARELNKEGYQLAKKNHNMYAVVNGLLAQAEYDYADGKYNKIANHAKTLQQEYEDKGYVYPLFSGRMKRLQAMVAFKNQDYDTALHYYKQGLAQIAQHGGYGVYSIDSELNALKSTLKQLKPSDAVNWCKTCKAYWEKQEPTNKYKRMLGWCDLQITKANLRIKQHKA